MMKKKDEAERLNSEIIVALTTRQTSMLVATLCVVIGSTFLTGYFWGKRSVVMQFAHKVERDSFADQIYASLCALYDYEPDNEEKVIASEKVQVETLSSEINPTEQQSCESSAQSEQTAQNAENSCDDPVESISADQQETLSRCYAELVGFGSEQSATLFANKLTEKGYAVAVKKRSSITAKHKMVAWYQVVTEPHHDKDALQEMVDRIAQEEKIKGIRIVFI